MAAAVTTTVRVQAEAAPLTTEAQSEEALRALHPAELTAAARAVRHAVREPEVAQEEALAAEGINSIKLQ